MESACIIDNVSLCLKAWSKVAIAMYITLLLSIYPIGKGDTKGSGPVQGVSIKKYVYNILYGG